MFMVSVYLNETWFECTTSEPPHAVVRYQAPVLLGMDGVLIIVIMLGVEITHRMAPFGVARIFVGGSTVHAVVEGGNDPDACFCFSTFCRSASRRFRSSASLVLSASRRDFSSSSFFLSSSCGEVVFEALFGLAISFSCDETKYATPKPTAAIVSTKIIPSMAYGGF